jgi:hypothetical protein
MKRLKELPIPIKFIVIYVTILPSFYLFFIAPKLTVLRSAREDLNNIENELLKTKALVKKNGLPMEEERKKWKAVQARIDIIPEGINIPELMLELTRLAKACRIQEAAFSNTRNAPSFKLGESRVQIGDYLIKISGDCQYRNLAYFLKGLDDMALGAVVESLEVQKALPLIHAELQIRPMGIKK